MMYSKSGSSAMAAKSRSQTPLLDQREKRTKALFQLPKSVRQIPPRRPSSGQPEHGFHEQPAIHRRSAGIHAFARQMRFHPIPLVIFQNQTHSAHPSLRSQKELESDLRARKKPECQRALAPVLVISATITPFSAQARPCPENTSSGDHPKAAALAPKLSRNRPASLIA